MDLRRVRARAIAAGAVAVIAVSFGAAAQSSTAQYQEPYRPQFHFSPPANWTNDPNGLVYHDGEYHLFFQHNPYGNVWGNMSWGHAVSRDLVHWEHLPVALRAEGEEAIFSGSVVVDESNRSGLGTAADPPMVAVYTSARPGSQAQALAYSTDRGRTWTEYAGNPVLDIGSSEFRDPKVFWHEPEQRWVMAVALPVERTVALYASRNLIDWEKLSEFGPANAVGGGWECPDLFPLAVDGSSGKQKWVLIVSLNPGAIAGGSGTQYFVGDFDGTHFRADHKQRSSWLDYGKDNYAAVSWNGVPDGRRLIIGWMSNWQYADLIPTSPWRGAMTVPRQLRLETIGGRPRLVQEPAPELRAVRGDLIHRGDGRPLPEGTQALGDHARGETLEIEAVLRARTARELGLEVRVGADQATAIGYDVRAQELYVDRTLSGDTGFSSRFPGVQRAPLQLRNGELRLRILVDRSSVEVFADRGQVVLTDQVFPDGASDGVRLFARGGDAEVSKLRIHRLRSIWPR
jgi:fructan beta-fructosidase